MRLIGALLTVLPRVTPVQGHPCAFWADATGMERHGTQEVLVRALLDAAREVGFPHARAGIADSCIAAALATRERGSPWRVVPEGRDATFLRRRPLDLLPMGEELRSTLRLLGLRTCGQLADLSAAEVELRFGREGWEVWRLAQGRDPRWPFRPPAPDRAQAEADFPTPIDTLEPLRFVLSGLLAAVGTQLARRQRIPAALRLTLRLDDGESEVHEVRPARPTADARVLANLWRLELERLVLSAPVVGAALECSEEGAARADQLDAFRAPLPDPTAVQAAILPVLERWGEESLCRARLQGAHTPERHASWQPLGRIALGELSRPRQSDAEAEPVPLPARGDLRLCLRRLVLPHPVRVITGEDGRPVWMHLGALLAAELARLGAGLPTSLRVQAEGPERISTLWEGEISAREYWRVSGEHGWLGLLYRDARTDGWHLEGWFD